MRQPARGLSRTGLVELPVPQAHIRDRAEQPTCPAAERPRARIWSRRHVGCPAFPSGGSMRRQKTGVIGPGAEIHIRDNMTGGVDGAGAADVPAEFRRQDLVQVVVLAVLPDQAGVEDLAGRLELADDLTEIIDVPRNAEGDA